MPIVNDTRYPYTYACDLVRLFAGYNASGTVLSRSEASKIRQGIAEVLGIDDEELARKFADYYQLHQDDLTAKGLQELSLNFGIPLYGERV